MTERTMNADEFDEYFDNGGDITPYIIPGSERQPGLEGKIRVNINMPEWLVNRLDAEARRLAVSHCIDPSVDIVTPNRNASLNFPFRVMTPAVGFVISSEAREMSGIEKSPIRGA